MAVGRRGAGLRYSNLALGRVCLRLVIDKVPAVPSRLRRCVAAPNADGSRPCKVAGRWCRSPASNLLPERLAGADLPQPVFERAPAAGLLPAKIAADITTTAALRMFFIVSILTPRIQNFVQFSTVFTVILQCATPQQYPCAYACFKSAAPRQSLKCFFRGYRQYRAVCLCLSRLWDPVPPDFVLSSGCLYNYYTIVAYKNAR